MQSTVKNRTEGNSPDPLGDNRTRNGSESICQPPGYLSAHSKGTWRRIASEYELTPDAAGMLEAALVNYDRAQQAREMIAAEGIVQAGKRHPAVDVEKQAWGLYLRALRQLGLDIAPAGPVGRPAGH